MPKDAPVSEQKLSIPSDVSLPVYVRSDDSSPELAPAIPGSLLATLQNRVIQYFHDQLSLFAISPNEFPVLDVKKSAGLVLQKAESMGSPYLLVVLFSSRETETPTHLGAQPIMTQIPGVEVENFSLAELVLVDVRSKHILLQTEGRASATMEELTVPIGNSMEQDTDGRSILRANSAQLALDQALAGFQRKWDLRSIEK